jgi:arylformamidase
MRKLVFGGVAFALMTGAVHAQRGGGERLSQQCRREVVQLCGMDRYEIRACLRGKVDKLSNACRGELMARVGERQNARPPATIGGREFAYGSDPKQRLDFRRAPKGVARAPLVVFVHGGGWSIGDKAQGAETKPAFYNSMDHAFASLNYRLVPQVTPAEQAQDIANAIAMLRRNAAELGFDPNRITLMVHSAGAHLAALVSTDTRYLDKAGVPVRAITGTVLLDGAGYDVAAQMAYKGNRVSDMYDAAFGKDPAMHKALSPVTHVAAPNVSRWLILHVASRQDSKAQSEGLARGLNAVGNEAQVIAVPGSTHMTVNRDAGGADSIVGRAIAAFLEG